VREGVGSTCEGKVAVVTGAAGGGMGRSIALTLAREGAKVVVNYCTSKESAEAIVDYPGSQGGSAIAVQADVFDPDGCKHLVEAAVEQFGQSERFAPGHR
jgi:NAD(P)-dependent dehydrogenase (short-subunit alcohol dehydrogenase family)